MHLEAHSRLTKLSESVRPQLRDESVGEAIRRRVANDRSKGDVADRIEGQTNRRVELPLPLSDVVESAAQVGNVVSKPWNCTISNCDICAVTGMCTSDSVKRLSNAVEFAGGC